MSRNIDARSQSKAAAKAAAGKKKPPATVEALVQQGNMALSNVQPELASKFFKRALDMEPQNTGLMDALADALIQMGNAPEALQYLQQSVTLQPDANPCKWMFLGQLLVGTDALACYRTGIEKMTSYVTKNPAEAPVMSKHVVKAYCNLADLFLTDLCYEDDAESSCEAAVSEALKMDPNSLDGLLTLTNLRLSQDRKVDASDIIGSVFTKVDNIRKRVRARTLADDVMGVDVPEEFNEEPEMGFCMSLAKLLIECSSINADHASCAMELILDLLQDDDENIEIWYLMGVAALSSTPPDLECARYHLDQAKRMMDEMKEHQVQEALMMSGVSGAGGGEQEEFPFQQEYELVLEHLKMLDSLQVHASSSGPAAAAAAADAGAMEEEWSTCDEENTGGDKDEDDDIAL